MTLQPTPDPEPSEVVREARRALHCLYIAVVPSIASDIEKKVEAALAAARTEGAKARDMEWWVAVVLVDNVAPTPEAAKAWTATINEYAYEQGVAAGAEAERAKVVAYIRTHYPVHESDGKGSRWRMDEEEYGGKIQSVYADAIERGDHLPPKEPSR